MEPATCAKHGLRYDPTVADGCVVCQRERARIRRVAYLAVAVAVGGAVVLLTRAREQESPEPKRAAVEQRNPDDDVPREAAVAAAVRLGQTKKAPASRPAGPAEAEAAPVPGESSEETVREVNPADEIAKDFRERDKGHFIVRFEGHEETELAYTALEILDDAYEEIRGSLRVVPTERIEVIIYTGGKYRQAVAGPDWSVARYDGKIRVGQADLMAERGALRDTLFHEYGHALLSRGVGVPVWFHEGVAQYLEPNRPSVDVGALAAVAAAGELPTLEQLSRGFLAIEDPRLARLAYMQSLAVVEFMVEYRGADRLHGMIRQLAGGGRFATLYLTTYGDKLERRWRASLAR